MGIHLLIVCIYIPHVPNAHNCHSPNLHMQAEHVTVKSSVWKFPVEPWLERWKAQFGALHAKRLICCTWLNCHPILCQMLRLCSYKNDLAIAQHGAFDIAILRAQELSNSNVQPQRISIMTPKQT
ncbi:hypothetical protein O181_105926 [Austropuccinia psidii MF-1]|uniref:Uncharacterized protein n=1 Tax=Austropuccinia psidii MF-1 TaxID=1389203 RepID=A0A9Q3PMR3_9BASI|nr:hypothetical protein [Austropuccinia psidii MF-1]